MVKNINGKLLEEVEGIEIINGVAYQEINQEELANLIEEQESIVEDNRQAFQESVEYLNELKSFVTEDSDEDSEE